MMNDEERKFPLHHSSFHIHHSTLPTGMKLGIIGAMPQEIDRIAEELETDDRSSVELIEQIAGRSYHIGRFAGADCVLVFSHWGKVAAAITATTLIEHFGVDLIIFTGVAGAVSNALNVGDVVIADKLIQHDFDVSAAGILSKFEIPFLGISYFPVDERLVELAKNSAEAYLSNNDHPPAPSYSASLHRRGSTFIGTIASGDQFIAHPEKIEELRAAIPDLLCVEMEGAAVAQVCHEYGIPYIVIRTISDKADHSAPMDFLTFIQNVARHYSHGILERLIPKLIDEVR
jgi:adenosylhomocysteine nucleosidase